ncbi:MAG TPA: peptidylprolyl isomerase, partial [Gemmatimonadales bacterium]|nr:peptidylprolyl isomerase [Gemmatimonadales bacterium]
MPAPAPAAASRPRILSRGRRPSTRYDHWCRPEIAVVLDVHLCSQTIGVNHVSKTATITTSKGTIVAELFDQEVPNTVQNFEKLANSQFYDGTRFHR